MTRLLLRLVIAISLVGCTTGSELLTPVYPAIEDHTTVRILTEMPEGAEQIAVLKATSGWGNQQQFRETYIVGLKRRAAAVEDLQRRAAKLGANAVVLINEAFVALVPGVAGALEKLGLASDTEFTEFLNTTIDPSGRDGVQREGVQMASGDAIPHSTQFKIVEGIAIYVK